MRSNYVARTRSVDFYDIGLVNTTDKKLSYRKQVAHQHHARDNNAITQYIHCKIIPSSRHGTVRDRQTDRQTDMLPTAKTLVADVDQFLPRDAMCSAHYAVVRLSVRPSVSVCHTPVLCQNGYTFFTVGTKRHGNTPTGDRGTWNAGSMKKSRFSTNISFITEMIQDRCITTTECE